MFTIMLRFVGGGAPETVLVPAVAAIDHGFALTANVHGRWTVVPEAEGVEAEVGNVYATLEEALDDYHQILRALEAKEDKVVSLTELINTFFDQREVIGVNCSVRLEVAVWHPVTLKRTSLTAS